MKRKGEIRQPTIEVSPVNNWKLLGSCFIVLAWVYANISSIHWLLQSLRTGSPLELISSGGMAIALGLGLVFNRQRLMVFSTPIIRLAPLLLMLGSAIAAIAFNWIVDLEQINVLLFLLGTYGLIGLFISPTVWHEGLPVATIFACVFPFCLQFSTGLGFPVRVLTAHAVEYLLSLWNISAISSHDIIVLENAIAHVDLPCSGLKSLWIGTIFLLGATWIESRRISWRWLLVAVLNLFLLVWINIVRVFCLVVIFDVFQQPEIGQILHLPLGLLGFLLACCSTWVMLQFVPRHQQKYRKQKRELILLPSSKLSIQAELFALIIGLTFIPHPQHFQNEPLTIASIKLPEKLHLEPISLTKAEREFFAIHPGSVVQKQRFDWVNLSGSAIFVSGTSWRVNHSPELCLVASGFKVNRIEKKQLTPEVIARWLSLENRTLSAAYWFQSPQYTTDEILVRIWQEVSRKEPSWVLVSILFDRAQNADSSEIKAFTDTIHDAIAEGFHNRI